MKPKWIIHAKHFIDFLSDILHALISNIIHLQRDKPIHIWNDNISIFLLENLLANFSAFLNFWIFVPAFLIYYFICMPSTMFNKFNWMQNEFTEWNTTCKKEWKNCCPRWSSSFRLKKGMMHIFINGVCFLVFIFIVSGQLMRACKWYSMIFDEKMDHIMLIRFNVGML